MDWQCGNFCSWRCQNVTRTPWHWLHNIRTLPMYFKIDRYVLLSTLYLNSQIPQCTYRVSHNVNTQNKNVYVSVLNGALWDMGNVHCSICENGLLGKKTFQIISSAIPICLTTYGLHVKISSDEHIWTHVRNNLLTPEHAFEYIHTLLCYSICSVVPKRSE